MRRLSTCLAVTAGALALTAGMAPAAGAQPFPGGSLAAPVVVPRPFGLPTAQLPALPFPLEWQADAPRYVASNWVEVYTGCPAPGQWAYTQNGTTVWCSQVFRTDAHMWAPTPDVFTPPAGASLRRSTSVGNSLGGKQCATVGEAAVDPSNGQRAVCDWRRIEFSYPVWTYPR